MDFKTLALVLLGGILVNNLVFEQYLGVAPFLGCAKRGNRMAGMGAAVTLALVLSTLVLWPIQTYVLKAFQLEYLQTLVFLAVILVVVYLVNALAGKLFQEKLGVYFPLTALNAAVLGLALNMGELDFVTALVAALGAGLGFLLGMPVFAALMDRLEEANIPKAFRGLPIRLLTASIISMALLAFK